MSLLVTRIPLFGGALAVASALALVSTGTIFGAFVFGSHLVLGSPGHFLGAELAAFGARADSSVAAAAAHFTLVAAGLLGLRAAAATALGAQLAAFGARADSSVAAAAAHFALVAAGLLGLCATAATALGAGRAGANSAVAAIAIRCALGTA